jgi:hypothetical protein
VTTYQCVDGPLAGRTVTRRRAERAGRVLTVDVVDVEHAVLEVDYRVLDDVRGAGAGPGRLRFVAARDVRRRRGPLWWLAPA